MKCFYHSVDLDGHCSGAIVKYNFPECELIGINYGDKFPWEKILQNEIVYMVDFSLQPFDDMERLCKYANLIWIDHHESALNETLNRQFIIKGLQRNGIGACALTWEYINCSPDNMPMAIRLLAEYDVWNHSNPDTLPFQFGIRLHNTIPEQRMNFWEEIFYDKDWVIKEIINDGKVILKYQSQENEKYCSACAFETELDGLKCIALNKMLTNSQLFDSVWNPDNYDAMLTFGWRKGSWTVSLYSTKSNINVSTIAKNHGGGGHKGAAGFQCKELPFKLV